MYCRNCGKEIPNDSNFCPNCGKRQSIETYQEIKQVIDNNENLEEKQPVSIVETTERIKIEESRTLIQTSFWRRAIGSIIDKVIIIIISLIVAMIIGSFQYDFFGDLGIFSAMFHMGTENIYNCAIGNVMPNYPNDLIADHQAEIQDYYNHLLGVEVKFVSIFVLINILYFGFFESLLSSTPGKRIMGLKLACYPYEERVKLSPSTIFLRLICLIAIISGVVAARWQFGFNNYITVMVFFIILDSTVIFRKQSLIDIISSCILYRISKYSTEKTNNINDNDKTNISEERTNCSQNSNINKYARIILTVYIFSAFFIIHSILVFYLGDYYNISKYFDGSFNTSKYKTDYYKIHNLYKCYSSERFLAKNIGNKVPDNAIEKYDASSLIGGKLISAYYEELEGSYYVGERWYKYADGYSFPRSIYKKYLFSNSISIYDISDYIEFGKNDESSYNKFLDHIQKEVSQIKNSYPYISKENGHPAISYHPNSDTRRLIICANKKAYLLETKSPINTLDHQNAYLSMFDFNISDICGNFGYYLASLIFLSIIVIVFGVIIYRPKKILNRYAYTLLIISLVSYIVNMLIFVIQIYALDNGLNEDESSASVLIGTVFTAIFISVPLSLYYIKKSGIDWEKYYIVPSILKMYYFDSIKKEKNKNIYLKIVCYPLMVLTLLPFGVYIYILYSLPSIFISSSIIYFNRWRKWVRGNS